VASLTLQSNPGGAEIWVAPLDGTTPKKLGITPLSTGSDEAQKLAGTTGPIMVEFRKDGYLSSRSMVTDLVPADIAITAQLQRSSGLENIEALNGVVDRLFEAQRLVRAGRLDDALKLAITSRKSPVKHSMPIRSRSAITRKMQKRSACGTT